MRDNIDRPLKNGANTTAKPAATEAASTDAENHHEERELSDSATNASKDRTGPGSPKSGDAPEGDNPQERPETIHVPVNQCGKKREHWRGDCRGLARALDSRPVPAAAIPEDHYPKCRVCTTAGDV